jgi:hypothetical protein
LVDEFKGDPNHLNRVLAERPYPLQLGGEPVLTAPQPDSESDKPADDKTKASGKTASN